MKRPSSGGRGGWSVAGGAGRDHSALMEVEVDKVCNNMYMYTYTLYDASSV